MECEPDVRWEGVSHKQIVAWTSDGLGAAVTERLEARLADATKALYGNSDEVNAALQRFSGGEWTGGAATAAAAAMRVMRDFDDIMGHHAKVNGLAAYGQSDNAAWAKANVPPYVDMRAVQVPTGTPLDAFNATADHQHQARAAKEAEERARQVMREYHRMTSSRIAALPPLSPAPQVVVTTGDDPAKPSGGGPDDGSVRGREDGRVPPRDSRQEDGARQHTDGTPRQPSSTAPVTPAGATVLPAPVPPPGAGTSTHAGTSTDVGAPTRTAAAATGGIGAQPDPDVLSGPLRETGHPGSRTGGAPTGDIIGNAPPRAETHRSTAEAPARATRGGSPYGVLPGATTRTDDDKEHRGKYTVPASEIFEPDNDDGMLHDPFRPGSYVAPPAIGDDDE